uniref:Interferon/interleukin receptor domain-containing protein n=1 Tax=Hucho hucho TaxID=62062 RepID=A0A4W5KLY1_9TELE
SVTILLGFLVDGAVQEGNCASGAIRACSHAHPADSCSPVVQIKPQAGFLIINIGKNCLWDEHGDHCHYVVNYGREGEKLEEYVSKSPETLRGLEIGGRYCVQVRYVCYHNPFGTSSPLQCVSIPESERTRHTRIVAISVTLTILLGFLVVGLAFIYRHHEKIKQFLQPPLQLPDHYREYLLGDFPQQALSITRTTRACEESHDLISIVCCEEDQSDREQD